MTRSIPHALICVALIMVTELDLARADEDRRAELARFETHIRPELVTTCIKCHGPKKQEGSLRLDSLASMLKGGESGPAIVVGEPEESLLISALQYDELEMPPSGPLEESKVRQFARWIRGGAPWPDHTEQLRPVTDSISDEDRNWWAFRPLQVTKPPAAAFPHQDRNEIDRFVHHQLQANQLTPAPAAEPVVLIRRLYHTVLGLPPTLEEVDDFLADPSHQAYEHLIDSLLADRRYGEHWAQFWLDAVRYAESDGWKADGYRPDIWRYRDYVVHSLNDDKPYPQFVREQLAGDEMDQLTPESLAATGYLRLGIYEYNQRNARQHWDDILNEITDVTGDVFFGIGFACARCHNHKFDPLLKSDYYKLRAFFEPIVFDDEAKYATQTELTAYEHQMQTWERETASIRDEIQNLLKPYYDRKWHATVDKFPLDIQASFRKPVEQRNSWDQQMAYLVDRQFYEEGDGPLKSMKEEDKVEHERLKEQLTEYESSKPEDLPSLMSASNFHGEIAATTIPDSGDAKVAPGFPLVLAGSWGPEFPDCGPKRRTALAAWIGSPKNPLTTRVVVNRVWKQHFGQGIVRSVSDFGTLGGQPSHTKLLDWLTHRFIENGWSFKRLHKQILMSSTWRQSSSHPLESEYVRIDPENKFLWRHDAARLTAEQIRDAMYWASGELSYQIGGPSVDGMTPRRSLYVKRFRNTPDRFLHAFDIAVGLRSVGQRVATTTPTQALMMINGETCVARAENMARRLGQYSDPEQRIRFAMRLAWTREPTSQELKSAMAFVSSDSTQEEFERLADFCHVLLNSNEFLYVD